MADLEEMYLEFAADVAQLESRAGRRRIDLETLEGDAWKTYFRFDKDEVHQLAFCMRLPEQIRAENMIVEDKITALCMLLAGLALPNWLANLCLKFGWKPEWISRIVKELHQFIHETWRHLLVFDAERLTPQRLSAFTIAIRERNAPLEICFGFVDGTLREIARPIHGQEAVYNGWKHMHCLKYQAVIMLDGITIHLFGLVEGSIHDTAVWSQSRLLNILEVQTHDPNGTSLQLYGNSAYGINKHLIKPFGSAYINQDQQD